MDPFRELSPAHERLNIRYVRSDLQNFDEGDFDVVFLFGVFYTQTAWDACEAFKSLLSKLVDKGKIVIIDNEKRDVGEPNAGLPYGYYNLSEMCGQTGATIRKVFIQANGVHRVVVIEK